MAVSVDTLQKTLEKRANNRAETEAARQVNQLGYFDSLQTYGYKDERCNTQIEDRQCYLRQDLLMPALREAIKNRLYKEYLAEEIKNLVDAVDRLEDLTAEVDNIQRNG